MAVCVFPRRGISKPSGLGGLANPVWRPRLLLLFGESPRALDLSTRNVPLTVNGSPQRYVGTYGPAISLNGSTDYIRHTTWLTGYLEKFTLLALFRTTQTTCGRLYQASEPTWNDHTVLTVNESTTTGVAFGHYYTPGGPYDGWIIDDSAVANDGKWHVLIGTQRKTNDREMFLDGKSRGTSSVDVPALIPFVHADIGRQNNADGSYTGNYFSGQIALFAILERGLSPAEARLLTRDLFWCLMADEQRIYPVHLSTYLTLAKYRFRYDDGDLGAPP